MSTVTHHTYGVWRKPRSTGLAGATFGTSMLGIAAIVVIILIGLFVSFIAALGCGVIIAIAFVPLVIEKDGRSGYERTLLMVQWRRAHKRGEHTYSSGTFSRIPGGRYRLPGVLADTEVFEGIDANNRPFGMIHMPEVDGYTVVLDAFPQGAESHDQATIDQAVGNWSQMLTSMGETSDILAIAAVVESLPDTGIELYETVSRNVNHNAPKLARDSMYQLATGLTHGSVRLGARISITFQAQTSDRKKDPAEQAVEIARRLPSITAAAGRAGVPATPMSADDIIGMVRRSYDPSSLIDVERGLFSGEGTGMAWADCGPRSAITDKDRLVHDGAVSVTWEMREAPKGAVTERVLQRLIEPNTALPIKRVAIIYRPHAAAEATEIVDRDYRDALAATTTSRGIPAAKAQMDVQATEQTRNEQARGHGLTRFGILITVTQPAGSADVPRVDALVRDLSTQCRLQVRRSTMWQDAAFACSLGVGVIAPEHTSIPSFFSA